MICIIAEAGVNHNGDFETAVKMADAAKSAGADFVKYQTFVPHNLASKFAGKAKYQKETTDASESQIAMLEKLTLPREAYKKLKEHCEKIGIGFISTPFDLESISLLEDIDIPLWKIPSGEVTNLPYLIKLAKTGKPVIMSTGMCEIEEIRAAIDVLMKNGTPEVTVLHCNTEYPTPYEDVNLKAMETMREQLGVRVGYSDHTRGIEIPIAAAALGAAVIEKHFTLDRNMEGPDHKASLEPDELTAMVSAIRHIEAAMGDGQKRVSESEHGNIEIVRKSIVASRKIKKGEEFTEDNITVKRPASGISPMRWYEVIGTNAVRDFEEDELIEI